MDASREVFALDTATIGKLRNALGTSDGITPGFVETLSRTNPNNVQVFQVHTATILNTISTRLNIKIKVLKFMHPYRDSMTMQCDRYPPTSGEDNLSIIIVCDATDDKTPIYRATTELTNIEDVPQILTDNTVFFDFLTNINQALKSYHLKMSDPPDTDDTLNAAIALMLNNVYTKYRCVNTILSYNPVLNIGGIVLTAADKDTTKYYQNFDQFDDKSNHGLPYAQIVSKAADTNTSPIRIHYAYQGEHRNLTSYELPAATAPPQQHPPTYRIIFTLPAPHPPVTAAAGGRRRRHHTNTRRRHTKRRYRKARYTSKVVPF
jgi:hypothetical protein